MKSGRFSRMVLLLLLAFFPWPTDALAFWGKGKSGLDFEKGYDLNTVSTVKGKVVSTANHEDGGPVTILIRQNGETIYVVTAPVWYWSDRGISMTPNDEIEVSGAKAQGKDGNMYMMSREIINRSTGKAVTLRTESGRPAWRGGARSGGSGGGMQRRFGGRGMGGR